MKRNIWFFRLFFALIACTLAIRSFKLSYSKDPSFWCFLKGSLVLDFVQCDGTISAQRPYFAYLISQDRLKSRHPEKLNKQNKASVRKVPIKIVQSRVVGIVTFSCLFVLECMLKKLSLRAVNTAIVGLFVGSLMGLFVLFCVKTMLNPHTCRLK